jgi:hypothetical protein
MFFLLRIKRKILKKGEAFPKNLPSGSLRINNSQPEPRSELGDACRPDIEPRFPFLQTSKNSGKVYIRNPNL